MRGARERPARWGRPIAWALLVPAITVLTFLVGSPAAQAHPIGNFTLNLYSGIQVLPGLAHIDYVLEMAEISTQEQKAGMDLDGDGEISEAEREGFAERAATQIGTNLTMVANGQPVELRLVDSTLRFRTGQAGLDLLYMQATFEGDLPDSGEVRYTDANYDTRPGWREIVATAGPGIAITASTVPDQTLSDELKAYPSELASQPLDVSEAVFSFQPSDAPVEPTASPGAGASDSSSPAGSGGFADLLATSSDRAIWLLVVLAFGFGFLHALGPGHGKTVMAASTLSGSVRLRHAFSLGGAVALMHCATVVALGLIAYAASRKISSELVYSGLRLFTALIVLAVGTVLVLVRWSQRHAAGDQVHEQHAHRHPHPAPPPGTSGVDRAGIAAIAASGGLIPSPSAVVVLLGAIAVDRIPLGVTLVVVFSIGLATSLVLVGAVSHFAGTRLGRAEGRVSAWLPLAAAVTILAVGIVLTVQAASAIAV